MCENREDILIKLTFLLLFARIRKEFNEFQRVLHLTLGRSVISSKQYIYKSGLTNQCEIYFTYSFRLFFPSQLSHYFYVYLTLSNLFKQSKKKQEFKFYDPRFLIILLFLTIVCLVVEIGINYGYYERERTTRKQNKATNADDDGPLSPPSPRSMHPLL